MENKEGKEALTPRQWWDSFRDRTLTFGDFENYIESFASIKVAEETKSLNDDLGYQAQASFINADTILSLKSQLAEKYKEIGLMDIQINHLKTLLESCEKSLRERELEVAESRKEKPEIAKEI